VVQKPGEKFRPSEFALELSELFFHLQAWQQR